MTATDSNLPSTSGDPTTTPVVGVTFARRNNARGAAAAIDWRIAADPDGRPVGSAGPYTGARRQASHLTRRLVAIYSDMSGRLSTATP